jgi:hypothetical protein
MADSTPDKEPTMPALVDPQWQEHATSNAAKGFPWAVWGSRDGRPLGLHASVKTKAEAERIADLRRTSLRPKGEWTLVVTFEG